jgi:parvulin-like peptidyl-prolyl isomerase
LGFLKDNNSKKTQKYTLNMNKYSLPILILIFISILNIKLLPQNLTKEKFDNLKNKIVATVGDDKITGEEFLQRYEFTPLFRKQIKRMTQSLKLEFLYSLISEKLWALQAKDLGYDTLSVMKYVSSKLEDMFVRDALYRREIKDKVKISDKELLQGYMRYNTKLEVRYIFAKKLDEIKKLYNLLKIGVSFDSLLATRPEAAEQVKPREIGFGQMDVVVEDSLYALKIGQFTEPVYSEEGWYIFKLINRIRNVMTGSHEDAVKTVKTTIEARKEEVLYKKYFDKFFGERKVEANAPLFRSLARKISKIFTAKKKAFRVKKGDPVYLDVRDVENMEKEFGHDSLEMSYIKFEKDPKTLKGFIEDLAWEDFSSVKTDTLSIMRLLNIETRANIEHELLAREGLKEGLQYLPSVQRNLHEWRENYLAQILKNKFLDSAKISNQELYNYYRRYNKDNFYPEEVNIVEVFNRSTQVMEKVLQNLKKGVDIKKLAFMYTQRSWTKKDSGEFGYFPITLHGEIGRIAASMKVGDVYGPLKIDGGYSVFKLIGKRAARTELAQPFDKVKDDLRRNLEIQKEHKAITDYTVKLAQKFGIVINGSVLRQIPVTHVNSFGFRYLGFGGRLTAAPLMTPNVDWVSPYLKSLDINP